jgi:hypothetical protein
MLAYGAYYQLDESIAAEAMMRIINIRHCFGSEYLKHPTRVDF